MAISPIVPSAPVRVVWFYGELERLLRTPGGPVGRHLHRIAQNTALQASLIAKTTLMQRTGRYAAGFKVETLPAPYPQGFKFKVVNRTTDQHPKRAISYAATIEFGSARHTIRARNPERQKLHFYWASQGRWVTTSEVTHPGTKAYSILRIAFERAMSMSHGGP